MFIQTNTSGTVNKENGVFDEPELADWGIHGSESPLNTIHQLELEISLI
jgi:hypothetical protein